MDAASSLRFLDFPLEIQQLIIRKCLEGWKATVETHEKPQEKKSTTRLWSSVVYDALMLSLTCRHFHAIIQSIQKDPRLFSGEIDLIEANAELSYLVGVFTSNTDQYYAHERGSLPRPLYRTQIFIKANPYDRSDPNWRVTRLEYHAAVRNWLNQNVRSLEMPADELTSRIPWELFPSLKNIIIYWPYTYFNIINPALRLCEHSREDLKSMAQTPKNLMSDWNLDAVITELGSLAKPGVTVTVKYEVPHVHLSHSDLTNVDDYIQIYDKFFSADYYNLECSFTVQQGNWTQTSVICHGQSRMQLKAEERERFAELSIDDQS